MKRKVIILLVILSVITSITLINIKKSYAWESSSIDKNAINVTIQSNYIENDATMAVTLKSANVYGEGNNELTKNELIEAVKGKYGVNIIKTISDPDGVTVAEGTECVGTGYKIQLVTNKMLTVVLYGDVDCNGVVDTDDTVAIAKHNVNTLELNKYQEKAAHLTVKKNAKDLVIDTDDTVRVAFYNVNGLGKGHAGETIVDTALYPADEQFESGAEVENINDADDTYKTALSAFTKNEFTKNNDELELNNEKLEGTVNYNFAVEKDIFPEDELTGYYFGYVIKAQGANENTTLKIKNSDKEVKEIPYSSFDTSEGISMIASLSKTATNKKIEIEVDLDGAGTLYKPYTKIIDYTNLQFGDIVSATISYNIPKSEAEKLEGEDWNYRFEFSHSHSEDEGYTITKEDKNKYKVTGIVTKQAQVTGFSENAKTNYYLAFAIEPNYVTDDIKIKIPLGGESYNTVGKDALVEDKLTALISIKEDGTKSFKILVDLDGEGDRFQEEEIIIDYSDLKFEKSSQFEVKKELPQKNGDNGNAVKEELKKLGFTPENYLSLIGGTDNLEITVDPLNKQFYTVKGTIPKMTDVHAGFDNEDQGGYYIVFTVKMENSGNDNGQDKINENVKVTFTSPAEEENASVKEIGSESFDTATEMAVLWKLDEERTDENKTLKVTIDLDGDSDDYAPYHVILDYSELVLQKESSANISFEETTLSKKQKEEFKNYGYKFQDEIKLSEDNSHLAGNKKDEIVYNKEDGLLTGIAKEQVLTSGYAGEDLDSYFFTYTIEPEKVTEEEMQNIKVTIKNNQNEGEDAERVYTFADFDEGKLNILQHIPKDFEKCVESECCNGTGNCVDAEKCKNSLKITIDIDGDTNYGYKSSEVYYIDYCNLDFVDLHTVKFTNKDGSEIKDESDKTIDSVKVYDGEKLVEPSKPAKKQHEGESHKYTEFQYWRIGEEREQDNDYTTKYEFTDGKSEDAITADLTLFPMWEIDVDQYIADSIEKINTVEDTKKYFQIEKDNQSNITIDIEDNSKTIDELTDTGIADVVAHALMSDEVKEIDLELNSSKAELKLNRDAIKNELTSEYNETKVEEKVAEKLKEYFKKDELSGSGHTLESLCATCKDKELKLIIEPDESVANAKGKANRASVSYEIKFEKEYEVTFNAGALGKVETIYAKKNTTVEKLPEPTMSDEEKKYRIFDGWFEKGKESQEAITKIENINEDKELEAHYSLIVDKFVEEVVADLNEEKTDYSDSFKGLFNLSKDGKTITMNVEDTNVPLAKLAETSIPGTIAYILQRGEIKDITLDIGDESVVFNSTYDNANKEYVDNSDIDILDEEGKLLKKEIIEGAKDTFDTALDKHEDVATLDQLEFDKKSFSLKIGDVAESKTVKLVKENPDGQGTTDITDEDKTYTFNLKSNFAVVDADAPLGADTINEALNSDYKKIYIDSALTLQDSVTINKDVTIEYIDEGVSTKGSRASTEKIAISGENKDNIFNISDSKNVTLVNLNLSGKTKNAGIEVGNNATLNVSGLTYDGEGYNVPAIRTKNGYNSSINLKDGNNKNVQGRTSKKTINKYENLDDAKKSYYSDELVETSDYDYIDYFANGNNSRIYEVKFIMSAGPYRGTFTRYCQNGESPVAPPETEEKVKYFNEFNYEGTKYTLNGYSVSSNGVNPIDKNQLPAVNGSNVTYYASYDQKISDEVKIVEDVEAFKEALKDNQCKDIYIASGVTIDYTDNGGVLETDKSIIGKGKDNSKSGLKVKQIVFTSDNEILDKLNIEGTTNDTTDALIKVTNPNFTLYSSNITTSGAGTYTDCIKITTNSEINAQIRWNKFSGDNIGNFINLDGPVSGKYNYGEEHGYTITGTDILMNTFSAPKEENKEHSDVIIKKFADNAEIRLASNTFSTRKYNVRLSNEAAGQTAGLRLNYNNKVTVGLEAKESNTDFSTITIKTNTSETDGKITQEFIGSQGQQATVKYEEKVL